MSAAAQLGIQTRRRLRGLYGESLLRTGHLLVVNQVLNAGFGVLYWLLAGQKPFPSDRPVIEELLARQRESPMPLHKLRPEVSLELEAIVYQMMAVDPGDRYPTPQAAMIDSRK